MNVTVMIGLPGSGKTTLARRLMLTNSGLLDDLSLTSDLKGSIRAAAKGYWGRTNDELIVDYAMMNMNDVNDFVKATNEVLMEFNKSPKFKFYVFNPDIDRALINSYVKNRGRTEFLIHQMYDKWDFEFDKFPGEVIICQIPELTKAAEIMYASKVGRDTVDNITLDEIKSDSWKTDIWSVEYSCDEIDEDSYYSEKAIDKYDNPYLEKFLNFLGDQNTDELRRELIDKLARKVENDFEDYYMGYVENYYSIDMLDLIIELEKRELL